MKYRLVLLFVLGLVLVSPLRAQDTSAPIIFNLNGDLWAWNEGDAAPRQLTHEGHIFVPLVAPDGKYILYEALSESELTGDAHSGLRRTDIWIMDIATGEAMVVSTDETRSTPAWSPDGTKIVW